MRRSTSGHWDVKFWVSLWWGAALWDDNSPSSLPPVCTLLFVPRNVHLAVDSEKTVEQKLSFFPSLFHCTTTQPQPLQAAHIIHANKSTLWQSTTQTTATKQYMWRWNKYKQTRKCTTKQSKWRRKDKQKPKTVYVKTEEEQTKIVYVKTEQGQTNKELYKKTRRERGNNSQILLLCPVLPLNGSNVAGSQLKPLLADLHQVNSACGHLGNTSGRYQHHKSFHTLPSLSKACWK